MFATLAAPPALDFLRVGFSEEVSVLLKEALLGTAFGAFASHNLATVQNDCHKAIS